MTKWDVQAILKEMESFGLLKQLDYAKYEILESQCHSNIKRSIWE